MVDPEVFRAFASVIGMVRRPTEVYGDPDVAARVRAAFAAGAVPTPPQGPSRAEPLATVDAAVTSRT